MPPIISAITVGFVLTCIASDLRTRRVPNVLSGTAMLVGLGLNALYFGLLGLGASAAGLVLATAVLLPPFALGGVGGGDVKMCGALGALLGPRIVLAGLCMGAIFGGVVAVGYLVVYGRLPERLRAVGAVAAQAAASRSLEPLRISAADPGAVTLPYTLPLGLGVVTALFLNGALGVTL